MPRELVRPWSSGVGSEGSGAGPAVGLGSWVGGTRELDRPLGLGVCDVT